MSGRLVNEGAAVAVGTNGVFSCWKMKAGADGSLSSPCSETIAVGINGLRVVLPRPRVLLRSSMVLRPSYRRNGVEMHGDDPTVLVDGGFDFRGVYVASWPVGIDERRPLGLHNPVWPRRVAEEGVGGGDDFVAPV